MQYKRLLNNNKILNRETAVYTNEEVENVAMKHDIKKSILYLHYLTSAKLFTKLKIFLMIKTGILIDFAGKL